MPYFLWPVQRPTKLTCITCDTHTIISTIQGLIKRQHCQRGVLVQSILKTRSFNDNSIEKEGRTRKREKRTFQTLTCYEPKGEGGTMKGRERQRQIQTAKGKNVCNGFFPFLVPFPLPTKRSRRQRCAGPKPFGHQSRTSGKTNSNLTSVIVPFLILIPWIVCDTTRFSVLGTGKGKKTNRQRKTKN